MCHLVHFHHFLGNKRTKNPKVKDVRQHRGRQPGGSPVICNVLAYTTMVFVTCQQRTLQGSISNKFPCMLSSQRTISRIKKSKFNEAERAHAHTRWPRAQIAVQQHRQLIPIELRTTIRFGATRSELHSYGREPSSLLYAQVLESTGNS